MKEITYNYKSINFIINKIMSSSLNHINIELLNEWKYYVETLIANPVTFRDGILITNVSVEVMNELYDGKELNDIINELDGLANYHIKSIKDIIDVYSVYNLKEENLAII